MSEQTEIKPAIVSREDREILRDAVAILSRYVAASTVPQPVTTDEAPSAEAYGPT